MQRDYPVHFRYHDAVNALIGRHRYRYERMQRSEVNEYAKYLRAKGFDEFSIRRLGTQEPWHLFEPDRVPV